MTAGSMVSRLRLDPPPDWQRGALRIAASHAPSEVAKGNAHEVRLWNLPGAADFSSDTLLSSTDLILAELEAQGALADLSFRSAARRAHGRGPGGAPRREGCWESLYLVHVDLGATAVTHFHSKLTVDLLQRCRFDSWPSPQLIYLRFRELEAAWEDFRAVKNLYVRAAVTAEPRLPGPVMIDATLVRSSHRLQLLVPAPRRAPV